MGLFDRLFKDAKETKNEQAKRNDEIVAIADGEMIDITTVSDVLFSQKLLGDSGAFRFEKKVVTLCSPCNGTLSVLFPTLHAFGITTHEGVEILIHCGVNTVQSNGKGFRKLKKKQGDIVKAGDPIVEIDMNLLSTKYDMSTIIIITNPNGKTIAFKDLGYYHQGESIIRN